MRSDPHQSNIRKNAVSGEVDFRFAEESTIFNDLVAPKTPARALPACEVRAQQAAGGNGGGLSFTQKAQKFKWQSVMLLLSPPADAVTHQAFFNSSRSSTTWV